MVMVCRRWRLPVRPYECVTKVPSKDPRLLGGLVASWMRQARREGALSEGAAEGRDEVLHRQDAQVQPAGDEMTRQDKTKKGPGEGVWQSAQYRRHSGGARLQTGRDYRLHGGWLQVGLW